MSQSPWCSPMASDSKPGEEPHPCRASGGFESLLRRFGCFRLHGRIRRHVWVARGIWFIRRSISVAGVHIAFATRRHDGRKQEHKKAGFHNVQPSGYAGPIMASMGCYPDLDKSEAPSRSRISGNLACLGCVRVGADGMRLASIPVLRNGVSADDVVGETEHNEFHRLFDFFVPASLIGPHLNWN